VFYLKNEIKKYSSLHGLIQKRIPIITKNTDKMRIAEKIKVSTIEPKNDEKS